MPDITRSADPVAAYLAEVRAQEQAATKGPWHAEPITGAGRVWVQIGRRMGSWSESDCEPLFDVRHLGQNPAAEDYRQREADAAFIVAARNRLPVLLAALEAVLAAHRPTSGGDGKDRCCWCRDYHGERSLWPCGEYLTIKAKLLGPETAPAGEGPDHA